MVDKLEVDHLALAAFHIESMGIPVVDTVVGIPLVGILVVDSH
jgi:hypothetical protein